MSVSADRKTIINPNPDFLEAVNQRKVYFKLVITVFYAVGIIGMMIPAFRPAFQMLTPFHLLLSLGILFLFHRDWNLGFLIFAAAAFLLGYGSEVMGVHTGFPFGNYSYGPVLGFQLFEVPLMIGVNWLLLVYMTGNLFKERVSNDLLAAALSASLMVLLDVAIEPVAVALDFWTWEGDIIPLSNFIGWFGVAFLIQLIYRKVVFDKSNAISFYLLLHMAAFFVLLNLLL